MSRLEDLNTFAKVVDSGSFSAAARLLGSTKSAVSKQVQRLEGELGARLLHRTTRSISLSAEGQLVYTRALRMLEEAQALDDELAGRQQSPRGVLHVSTSTAFGNLQLAQHLREFCERYPQLQLVLGLNDRYVDLAEEGFDVVLRLAANVSPGLVARRIAPVHYVLCASSAYLAEHGVPQILSDLQAHRCIRFGYVNAPEQWNFRQRTSGQEQRVTVQSALTFESGLTVNSSESLRIAVLSGMGLAIVPTYAVGDDLRTGRVQSVLPDWQPLSPTRADVLHAVYLPSRFPSPKVRAFIDFVLEKFGEQPPWDRDLSLG